MRDRRLVVLPLRKRVTVRDRALFGAVSVLGRGVIESLVRLSRWELRDFEVIEDACRRREPLIFAVWHDRALIFLALAAWYLLRRGHRVAALVSSSRDGRLIARVLADLGGDIATGSSSREGAQGLNEMRAHLDAGRFAAITVDGPRGPRHVVKNGAITLARRTGIPIVPLSVGVSRALEFPSWDRTLLPAPGARIVVQAGPVLRCETDMDLDGAEQSRATLQTRLLALNDTRDRSGLRVRLGSRRKEKP